MIRHAALIACFTSPAFAEPQPAVAELMHYTTPLAACVADAETPAAMEDCIGDTSGTCMQTEEGGFSTVGMMFCALAEYHAWDAQLNLAYGDTMDILRMIDAEEAEFFPEFANRADTLCDAQRAWIPFRDATCAVDYAMWGSGSMRQIAGADCLLDETAQRTIYLKFLPELQQ